MALRGAAIATVALLAVLAIAGCTGIPCDPGETAIENVPANASDPVRIGGTIEELSESRIVLTDGTGRALLVSLEGYRVGAGSPGDCVVAEGTAIDHREAARFDVVLRTTTVQVERR